MQPAIYVITYHAFNHEGPNRKPLDKRFLESSNSYIFYLIDKQVPPCLKDKRVLCEQKIDPVLHQAGGSYFGEWSFLLAEAKHAFCQYPFFMVSSRFYEKNTWLVSPWDLDAQWERLFGYLQKYQWGYLPSYDRPLRWIDLAWKKRLAKASKGVFFPFTSDTFALTEELFSTRVPEEYGKTSDLFCNYIGFSNRQALLRYVNFYKPLIGRLFDSDYQPKEDLEKYVKRVGQFRNEKPFTFYLELFSHLFFFSEKLPFFCLHYDGYYEILEKEGRWKKIEAFNLPLSEKVSRSLEWAIRYQKSEGLLKRLRVLVKR